MTRHSELNTLWPEALLDIHEVDAERCGLRDGDTARVTSRRGTVVLRVNISPKSRPGVVFIPMHFAEAAANLLTIDVLDPTAKIPEYKACAVSITAARESELADPGAHQVRGRY
jgi:formate dehydrogenase major subunit